MNYNIEDASVTETSQLTMIRPTFQIGPSMNNPMLPVEWQKSPNAKRFELPPKTTIGMIDQDNTITPAPPLVRD